MALVFTAIADSWTTMLLHARRIGAVSESVWGVHVDPLAMAEMAIISASLYAFGLSLNDLIDRRRDQQLASYRPLPSGRLGVRSAHVITAALVAVAFTAAAMYSIGIDDPVSFVLVFWTCALITFYDYIGKYLVWPGLLTLGVVRLFHAAIPSPSLPLVWHPLLLMDHLTIVSTLAYVWEQKRPALTRNHASAIVGGLATINILLVGMFYWRRAANGASFATAMWITPGLWFPVLAILGFIIVMTLIVRTSKSYRDIGQRLWLAGLLWLVVYDASFVGAYVSIAWAAVIAGLLPVAYVGLKLLTVFGGIAALTRRPEFRRAE